MAEANIKTKAADIMQDDGLPDSRSRDLAKAIAKTRVATFDSDFGAIEVAYRTVEREFIARAGNDEIAVLETKRRIAEAVLMAAVENCQPFDTCRKCWDDMLRLGFTNIDRTCTMTWYYAECCRQNEQPSIGLGVLEPVINDLHRLLAEPGVTESAAEYYRHELDNLGALLDKLKTAT
ncbi:MAG: hypothetical protein IPM54_19000 [Polyangiaceae bacterium]|nr:hypothetical protein [Polyangiaceae bacterium]